MSDIDPRQVVEDLEELADERPDLEIDADSWWSPAQGLEGHIEAENFSYISVEVVPFSSSTILNDVINEHELVIRSFSCGSEGFRATLDYEGRVHSE